MKKIWARIGMTLEVTDEEYEELRIQALNKAYQPDDETIYDDLGLSAALKKKFLEKGKANGDSYIPAIVFEEMEW